MSLHSLQSSPGWDAAVETFAGFVTHAYQNGDQYGTDKCFFGMKSVGEVYNYPVFQPSTAFNEADGLDMYALMPDNNDDITTTELPVDTPMKDYRLIGLDQIEVRPDLNLGENYAKMLGRALAEGKSIRLNNLLAAAAYGTDGSGSPVDNTHDLDVNGSSNVGTDLKAILNTIAATWDETGVPADGRHMMLKSTLWYELLGVPGIITKEYGGQANVQRPGEVIIYANTIIHNGKVGFGAVDYTNSAWTERLPSKYRYNMSNVLAVAWHEEAWALRHWKEPTTMYDWATMHDAFKAEARLTMGAAVIQPIAVHAITDSST